jgi:hypothetical protein
MGPQRSVSFLKERYIFFLKEGINLVFRKYGGLI